MISESEFNRHIDETLLKIEEAIDESGAEIDYENVSGILTLTFEDGSQIIINRQTPARQLWVAAKSGGHHFDFETTEGSWIRDRDRAPLFEILSALASDQAGESVALSAE